MPVVSRDVIWLLSQIRVISSELRQTCTCDGYTSCSCRRAHACSSGTVFVTVTVRAASLSEADLDRGKTWSQSTPMRSYASPALYCQR